MHLSNSCMKNGKKEINNFLIPQHETDLRRNYITDSPKGRYFKISNLGEIRLN